MSFFVDFKNYFYICLFFLTFSSTKWRFDRRTNLKQFYINIFSLKNFFYFIKITAHYCCFLKIWKLSYF